MGALRFRIVLSIDVAQQDRSNRPEWVCRIHKIIAGRRTSVLIRVALSNPRGTFNSCFSAPRRRLRIFWIGIIVSLLVAVVTGRAAYRTYRKWSKAPLEVQGKRINKMEWAAEKHELDFLAVGCTGSGDANQSRVAQAMEQECVRKRPDAVLYLGDNFYPHGVSSPDDPQWQSKFENMFSGPCLSATKFYAIPGNHDYAGSVAAQIQYTAMQNRWVMPARFYRLEWGKFLQLVAYDSTINDFLR